jgi:hypothetical protein
MTADNHIREALNLTPHNEFFKEVRILLHQALSAYKEAQIKDPRIIAQNLQEIKQALEEENYQEDWCHNPMPQDKIQAMLKEFGW